MDWVEWHNLYDGSPALKARLALVRKHLAKCFELLPAGPISLLSICAGDGRDLIGVLAEHPRRSDVTAVLVENSIELVERGRKDIAAAGFQNQLRFVLADATESSLYQGVVPVDVVLAAGVFGNLRPDQTVRLIGSLRALVRRDGYFIWTRHRRLHDGLAQIESIRRSLHESDFDEAGIADTVDDAFTVCTHRYRGTVQPLLSGEKLFEFTGYDRMEVSPHAGEPRPEQ